MAAGPNIQPPFLVTERPELGVFYSAVGAILFNSTRSGTTGERPASTMPSRWVGMPYFDTTLGIPVWLKSFNPDVWVDATGAPV